MATYSEDIILAATTLAATTPIVVNAEDGASLTIVSSGYSGVENAVVQVWDAARAVWVNYVATGTTQTFDVSNNCKDFYLTRGRYQIVKTGTVTAVGFTSYRTKE
jgi:hypothetical protein